MNTSKQINLALTAVLTIACCTNDVGHPADLDENGIDDNVDQLIVNAYCPFLHFDSSEKYWPCSALWFVQHSQLEGPTACNVITNYSGKWDSNGYPILNLEYFTAHGVIVDNNSLSSNPTLLLQALSSAVFYNTNYVDGTASYQAYFDGTPVDPSIGNPPYCSGVGSSTSVGFFSELGYHLNIDDTYQYGEFTGDQNNPNQGTPLHVGTYAHVIQLDGAFITGISTRPNYPALPDLTPGDLLVQYWQFFAYNDAQQFDNVGNHEGDILYLEVYLSRSALGAQTPGAIKYIVYHHHGDDHCGPTILPGNYQVPGTTNGIQHFNLPLDGHPICFLESGAHEWWPWASSGGECSFGFGPGGIIGVDNNSHDGLGAAYLTENILDLGQLFSPMPGVEPQIVLFFNGKWGTYTGPYGDPPDPPSFQFYPKSPMFVAYVDASALSTNSPEGQGSRYFPNKYLSDAQNAVEQTISQVSPCGAFASIQLKAGNYPGSYTFTQPLTLQLWGSGTATIGQ